MLGFSADGFLAVELSTNFKRQTYTPIDAVDKESARPDFTFALYPGHLTSDIESDYMLTALAETWLSGLGMIPGPAP